jgi:hypothetical protein
LFIRLNESRNARCETTCGGYATEYERKFIHSTLILMCKYVYMSGGVWVDFGF